MSVQETVTVTTETVQCDGNGNNNGHPRVFLTLGKEGKITCPYCSRQFVMKAFKEAAS